MTDLGIHKWGKLGERAEKEGTNLWRAKINETTYQNCTLANFKTLQNFQLPLPLPSKSPPIFTHQFVSVISPKLCLAKENSLKTFADLFH
jgi:hypothetical protein